MCQVTWALIRRCRVLPRQGSLLCSARACRLYPRNAPEGLRRDQASEDAEMPIRKPARERGRKMGPGIDGGEDAGMRVVDAGSRSTDRVFGMDGSESSATHEVRRPT